MKTNFFKKLYLFFTYRSKILKLETDLKIQFNLRIDNIFRLYTVLNIPEQVIEEPYNFRKSDIDTISRTYIQEYIAQLSQFLNSKGLTELYELYDLEKVDKFSYLIVFGYSLINTKRFARNLLYIWLPLFLFLIIFIIILLLII
jgi:hypothetical protein